MRFSEIPFWSDIKNEYLELRRDGTGREQALSILEKRYSAEINEAPEDDGAIFWISLADGQWENREISAETAEKAICALTVLEGSEWRISKADISRRRMWYSHSPMPEKKIGIIRRKFRCEWEIGDTFAYQLSGSAAEQNNVSGQFILMRKVSDVEFGDGRLFPVVTLSLWAEKPFPQTTAEFCSVPLLKLSRGRFGLPDSLYEYRTQIVIRSQKQLRSIPLIYVGNFSGVPDPEDEVIVNHAGCMLMVHPELFDRDFNIRIRSSRQYDDSEFNIRALKSRLYKKTQSE
jgi:hypothetical protein